MTKRELNRIAVQKYRATEKGRLAAQRAEEKRKGSTQRLTYRQQYLSSFKGRAYTLLNGARLRAKKRQMDCTITQEWVENKLISLTCEVTGLPLKLITEETYNTQNNMQPLSPCIDRINSKQGYTPENSRIVCCIFNMCKFHWTDEDVKMFVEAYAKRNLS